MDRTSRIEAKRVEFWIMYLQKSLGCEVSN